MRNQELPMGARRGPYHDMPPAQCRASPLRWRQRQEPTVPPQPWRFSAIQRARGLSIYAPDREGYFVRPISIVPGPLRGGSMLTAWSARGSVPAARYGCRTLVTSNRRTPTFPEARGGGYVWYRPHLSSLASGSLGLERREKHPPTNRAVGEALAFDGEALGGREGRAGEGNGDGHH